MAFNRVSIVLISFLYFSVLVKGEFHWSYENIDKWPGQCTTGKLQSPIDLQQYSALETSFAPFQFKNYDKIFEASMKNNKHSVEIRFKTTPNFTPEIVGGGLPSTFILDHMHFHWKSEHTIGGNRFPLELHLVHYDRQRGNLTHAKAVTGGLAVLSVLFNLSPDDDTEMQSLVKIIELIDNFPNKVVNMPEQLSPAVFLPCDIAGFYRYMGSLTTPGCDEVVIWTVFTNTQRLSSTQVKQFENILSDDGPLGRNYRPLQDINGRRVMLKRSPLGINNAISLTYSGFYSLIFCSLCLPYSVKKLLV